MARIDRSEVEGIARLARLRLEADDAEALAEELARILEMVALLDTLDTAGVEPTSHVLSLAAPLREDRARPSFPPDAALANAPAREGTAFAVPEALAGEEEG